MEEIRHSTSLQQSKLVPASLRRRWWVTGLIYGLSWICGYLLLPPLWHQGGIAGRWALQAALVLAYLLWQFRRGLPDNHRRGEITLLPTLGLGNSLTLLRGLAIGLLAGFLFLPRPAGGLFAWIPAILYTSLSILDYLDGYAARVTNHATRLGEALDGICDMLGVLVAVVLLLGYGRLPVWYLLVGVAAYLFRLGLWWRQRYHKPIFDLSSSRRRRMVAGYQMGFISVLFWPLDFPVTAIVLACVIFAGPLLAGFGRDWLVVSGRLDPDSIRYQTWRRRLIVLFEGWLPPLLRAGVVLLSLAYLWPIALNTSQRETFLLWPGTSDPILATNLLALVTPVATIMLALGLLARLAAVGLLAPTLIIALTGGLNGLDGALLAGVMLLTLLGGGKWSLWRGDDLWVTVQAGKAR